MRCPLQSGIRAPLEVRGTVCFPSSMSGATAGSVSGVRYLSGAQPGVGGRQAVGPISRPQTPRQWGCTARVSPLRLCNRLWLPWTRGRGWPKEWDGGLEAPSQGLAFPILFSTSGDLCSRSPRIQSAKEEVQSLASSQSIWVSAWPSMKQALAHPGLGELSKAFCGSVPNPLSQGLIFQESDSEPGVSLGAHQRFAHFKCLRRPWGYVS